MKKFISISVFVIAAILSFSSCDKEDEVAISPSAISNEVQAFLDSHFQGIEIQYVIQERERRSYDYEMRLSDGTRIEINSNGDWMEVENYNKGVPASVIPGKILEYVNQNYPNTTIVDIERDRQIDIKLKNGVELIFSLDGEFIRMDF